MSAQELREAAALMRSRATHPDMSASPWEASPHGDVHDDGRLWVCDSQNGETAEHIASWHPAVALKVAAALDSTAAILDESHEGPLDMVMRAIAEPLVELARTYLGGDQ